MIIPFNMPHKNRNRTPRRSSNLIVLHQIDDSRNEDELRIWALAITVQALLCIWMVIQASAPPGSDGTECTGNAICNVATMSHLKTVASNPVPGGVSEPNRHRAR